MDKARLELLDGALQALLEALQLSADFEDERRKVVTDMQQLVQQALPPEFHASVETFGSYRAGLHLPGSDLDFALAGWVSDTEGRQIELHEWNPLEQQYLLSDLADALEQSDLVQGQVERVLHARVPVIKFIHKRSGLACDFSVNRPECTFKADMQKLLGSLDRRYGILYRLIKAWAAAHGLNDAAANTLNSWSLGLLVAFYLQCGTTPAVLPPMWQLLEKQAPDVRQPRVLQLPNINSAMLKRVFNQAATGAGAYQVRRQRAGPDAVNPCSIGELLAGFFDFYAPVLTDWAAGRNSSWRASTFWGDWKEAAWYPAKNYIFSIEDPFNAGDNTARAVGTHNHLSSWKTASYIAATVTASHHQLQRALSSSSSSSSSSGSSSSSDGSVSGPAAQELFAACAWLFGPHSALQLLQRPNPLQLQLPLQASAGVYQQLLEAQLLLDLQACMDLLSSSSGLVNRDNSPVSKDPERVEQISRVLGVYRDLLKELGCSGCHVCLGDYLQHRRELEAAEAEAREQARLQSTRQRAEAAALGEDVPQPEQQQQQQQGASGGGGRSSQTRQQQRQPRQRQQGQMPEEVLTAMQGLRVGSQQQQEQWQARSGRSRSGQGQQQGDDSLGSRSSSGGGSSRSSRGQERWQVVAPQGAPVQHPSRGHQQQVHQAPADVGQHLGVALPRAQHNTRAGQVHVAPAVGSRLAASALAGLVGGGGGVKQQSSQQHVVYAEP